MDRLRYLLLAIGGLAYAFVRKGAKIKPDPENMGRSDQGYY